MMKVDKRLRASSNDVAERLNSQGFTNGLHLKSKDKVGGLALSTSLAPTQKRTLNNFYLTGKYQNKLNVNRF